MAAVGYLITSMLYMFVIFPTLSTTKPDANGVFLNIKASDTGFVFLYQTFSIANYVAAIVAAIAFGIDMYLTFATPPTSGVGADIHASLASTSKKYGRSTGLKAAGQAVRAKAGRVGTAIASGGRRH